MFSPTRASCLIAITLGLTGLLLCTASYAQPLIPLPGTSDYVLELIPFAKHTGDNAMDLTHANDGSGRVFLSTQSGQIFAYKSDGTNLGVFLDLKEADPEFTYDPEPREPFKGLMYIAFHPDYAKPEAPGFGKLYTGHQVRDKGEPGDLNSHAVGGKGELRKPFVIAEWQVDPNNPNRINPNSYRRVMLLVVKTIGNSPHAIGQIKFNPYANHSDPDYGKLYIAVGDGDHGNYSQTEHLKSLQQLDNPFGKILRIDPLAKGDQPYTVPQDNPFEMDRGADNTRGAAYAIGLRNPHWFSFGKDLEGQTVILTSDIGHLLVEEINLIRPGANYGWPRYEGALDFKTNQPLLGSARPPIVQYGHAIPARVDAKPEGGMTAITGGIVVSDPSNPSFQGQILFGDLPRGVLMHANYHHALTVEREGRQSLPYLMTVKLGDKTGSVADILGTERGDTRFGFDETGQVYIVSKQTDTIFKTPLIYTGLPVESTPAIEPGSQATDWTKRAIIVVTISLFALLLVVLKLNKPGRRLA